MLPDVHFFQRAFPSANNILLAGERPVLFDSGFGSDRAETVRLIQTTGTHPADLQMVVNSHYHCDHVGGNHHLQQTYNVPIAAHSWEAAGINRRDREACSALWLQQPIDPYTVNTTLADGDLIDTGEREWRVLHTPGHTLGHISLYADGVLLGGDTVHADDIAWLNEFREGAGAATRILQTLDRLAQLPLNVIYSGHGAANHNPLARIDAARQRYERWLTEPEKIGWHAVKRIFTYELMVRDGHDRAGIRRYLLTAPWYHDYCRFVFRVDPEDFIQPLLDEIERSGAGVWHGDVLYAAAPYNTPSQAWLEQTTLPEYWSS